MNQISVNVRNMKGRWRLWSSHDVNKRSLTDRRRRWIQEQKVKTLLFLYKRVGCGVIKRKRTPEKHKDMVWCLVDGLV